MNITILRNFNENTYEKDFYRVFQKLMEIYITLIYVIFHFNIQIAKIFN